jgi:hypothetical protein
LSSTFRETFVNALIDAAIKIQPLKKSFFPTPYPEFDNQLTSVDQILGMESVNLWESQNIYALVQCCAVVAK